MNTVSPEQQQQIRRTNNYIQPTPPQPTQPIANNYQPVSSYSSAIYWTSTRIKNKTNE